VLDDLGIKDGESVNLELDREQRRVMVTLVKKPIAIAVVNEEYARVINTAAHMLCGPSPIYRYKF